MTRVLVLLVSGVALLVTACGDDSSPGDDDDGPAVDAGGAGTDAAPSADADDTPAGDYVEVQPDNPVPPIMDAKIREAMAILAQMAETAELPFEQRLAAETYLRITEGAVKIDTIEDATPSDLYRMCRDYELDACAEPLDDPSTFAPDPSVVAYLAEHLLGYMWGDRMYFTITAETDVVQLAGTLVHEVNHVLNRSECSYYVDFESQQVDDEKAFLEEYRAFLTEYVYYQHDASDAATGHAYAMNELDDRGYGFDVDNADIMEIVGGDSPEALAASLFAEEDRFGWLIPELERWPAGFDLCEGE
jgi:hypothetical protein